MRFRVFSKFLEDLDRGDPVAITCLIILLVIVAIIGLIIFKVHRNLKRDDEARANRFKKKP